ncbi:MAG: Holliday junction branch migration protein RuvA [Clostridia bacterium]|nr:Holliday junction branch migration protein RuvA [Clostridia bacterium]
MFYYLNGELAVRDINYCVIDCGGVGYQLTISLITSESLASKMNQRVKLYTYLAVREDGVEMFGFGSNEERTAFNLLTSVSGVGPKAAMSILSIMTPERLSLAIINDEAKAIAKAQNIGAKTAARIILELKDKVAKDMIYSGGSSTLGDVASVAHTTVGGNLGEAAEALAALGYDRATVSTALKGIDSKLPSGEIIRLALKKLAR